jgi:hypothetical protein
MSDKKKIFIAVTQTGTILSRIVKWVTRDKYNHVSISLSEELLDLYSFGRKHPYNPFWAGFVKESPTGGTFGRFYKTDAVILEREVDALVYDEIKLELERMYENRNRYKYNFLGLFAGFFGKNVRMKNRYYCSEFVQYILAKHNIGLRLGKKELVCPNDFVHLPESRIIYEGKLREYVPKKESHTLEEA